MPHPPCRRTRAPAQVGARARGGYEGEFDVVALDPVAKHLSHVECSLDALSASKREPHFAAKFERGGRFIKDVFHGVEVPDTLNQVVVLQFARGTLRTIGGARVVTAREFIHEMYEGLKGTSPGSKAVPSNLPLLRTIQLAADAARSGPTEHRVVKRSPAGSTVA